MKTLKIICLFIYSFIILSCSNEQDKNQFPDKIDVASTQNLTRIKGTRLFVNAPKDYKAFESLIRLQKNDNTYFQVVEIPDGNINDYNEKMTRHKLDSMGVKVDVDKQVNYNGYTANYSSGPSKFPGETKLGLVFGTNKFIVIIVGVCKSNDKESMRELNHIIATSYYDSSYSLNPMELVHFTYDSTITGFKFSSKVGNMFIYTPNGKNDLNNQNNDGVLYYLNTMDVGNFEKAKEFVEYSLSRVTSQDMKIEDKNSSTFMINGNKAYEVVVHVLDTEKVKHTIYQIAVVKGEEAVIFMGMDNAKNDWITKYRNTAKTIRLN